MHTKTVGYIEPDALKRELATTRELALVDVRERGNTAKVTPFTPFLWPTANSNSTQRA